MHRLVPDFILQQYAAGKFQGRFPALALFADISGFSTITDSLMQHGRHGAEVLATCMRAVFDPLVRTIYQQGGFIAGFAGDAFTALFPDTADQSAPARAASACWLIQQQLQQNTTQFTAYGNFTFSARMSVGAGTVEWGILSARDSGRSTFYFRGPAITNCMAAQHVAGQSEVILTRAAWRKVQALVSAEPVGHCYRLAALADTLQPLSRPVQLPPVDVALMARFVPYQLVTQNYSGEFRLIFNLFVALKGNPGHAGVARFMQEVFDLQSLYGGLLNRIDFGDKGCHLLFFWGAPTAHENDISRVLNFILALRQRSLIPLRAGVTYRIAHAGFIGSPLHEEYTCYGRGVNLAARFMTAADWGEIWIDEEVAQRAAGFRITFHNEQLFKGFTTPQPVYVLNGHETRTGDRFFSRQLVGREAELAQLERFMEPLREGRFAGMAAVIGEAGIGKSHFVHHFLETSDVIDAADIFLCQTDEILRQSLNPFRYWLRDYFDQSPEQGEAINRQHFDHILDRLIQLTLDDTLRDTLARGRSFLGALVDLRWPESLYDRLEPQLRFENTLVALKTLIKAESQQQPVLIVLEDGQWLDEDSRRFLRRLARNVDAYPIAVLITSRNEVAAGLLAPDVPYLALSLPPLADTAVARLATGILNRPPAPDLLHFLQHRADGNPYLVEQLLLYLRENNLLRSSPSEENLAATGHLIPTDVQAVLIARLDRLQPVVKEVVQTAAVLGREFERPILAHMVGGSVDDGLEAATSEAIWRALDNRRYLFRHALVRDAAYTMQLHARLQQLHQQAAVAYETLYEDNLAANYGQIAYHYDQARVAVKALAYYERAADQARDNYQNEEALTYYGRALALADENEMETRYRLLLGQETVLNWLGRRQAQADVLAALTITAEQLDEGTKKARAALLQANLARLTSDYTLALDAIRQAITLATQAEDEVTELEAYHLWGRILWQQGDSDQARARLEQALRLARDRADQHNQAQNYYDIGITYFYQAQYATAQVHFQQALSDFRTVEDRRGEANCLLMLAAVRRKEGQYTAGHQYYEQALAICQISGWLHGKSFIYSHLGNSAFELGDYEQARRYHADALAICREVNDREGEAISLDTLGLIAHESGDFRGALAYFQQALAIQQAIGDQHGCAYTETHLGYTLTRLEQFEAAEAALQHACQLRQTLGETMLITDCLAGLAQSSLASGDRDEAQQYADDVLERLARQGIEGVELPVQVYWICYQVLQASPTQRAKARTVLEAGYRLLQERASAIQDEALRQQFLRAVPYNRALQQAWLDQADSARKA